MASCLCGEIFLVAAGLLCVHLWFGSFFWLRLWGAREFLANSAFRLHYAIASRPHTAEGREPPMDADPRRCAAPLIGVHPRSSAVSNNCACSISLLSTMPLG